jgi:pilus assembly protein Flp/PilA
VPNFIKRLARDCDAATVVEYGMLIALLSVVLIVGLQGFSNQLVNTWLIVQLYINNSAVGQG